MEFIFSKRQLEEAFNFIKFKNETYFSGFYQDF